jgi:exonuclease VII large subunit
VAVTPYAEPTDAQLAAQMQKMQQQMQQMQQQMQKQMQQTQQQMQQTQQQMQQQMQQQIEKQHMQQMNAWSYRPEDPLANFLNEAMEPAPACLPDPFEALKTLSFASSGTCLRYYGVATQQNCGRTPAPLGHSPRCEAA